MIDIILVMIISILLKTRLQDVGHLNTYGRLMEKTCFYF